jgi:DNA modification methylase
MSKDNTSTNKRAKGTASASQNEPGTQVPLFQRRYFNPKDLKANHGQCPGIPENPRFIRDNKYKALLKSMNEDPEFLEIREIAVYDRGTDVPEKERYVCMGGNMRYRAAKELGWTSVPCKVIPTGYDPAKIRRFVLKDNASFGETDWDLLINGFSPDEIASAAIDIPDIPDPHTDESEDAEDDNFDIGANTPKVARSKDGDIYKLGNHRLICGDSTKQEYLDALMDGEQADLLVTDPPYNVNYSAKGKMKIANDNMADANFVAFLTDAFKLANDNLKQGGAFYIWHADSQGFNFRTAAQNVGWQIRQCLIWNKNSLVLGRQDYQWKHEPCQPAGTKVMTTKGEKNIEDLTEQDRVISWDKLSGQVKGYRNGGYAIKTASREYDGKLYTIHAAGKKTRVTDNHQFSVRFNNRFKKNYCTYLMKRGNWWRVGQTKAYDSRQFGLKTRLHQEKADAVWLIGVHTDKIEAQVAEQILTCKYGIPYTIWEQDRFNHTDKLRSQKQIADIYAALDLQQMEKNAHRLLHDFNRSERFPLITKETARERFSTRVTAQIAACNLVPELMQVPIPTGNSTKAPNFTWQEITEVTAKPFKGRVYSLAVEKYQHYIADGIITHNCLYGWKDGASHYFVDKRSLTTVIEEPKDLEKMSKQEMHDLLEKIFIKQELPTTVIDCDKPARNPDHPTMKPVPLIGRLIANSSRRGDTVLDIFGGSGTTLIAAEQLHRKCRMVEFEPIYVDVIIKRWEELTGSKAVLIRNIHDNEKKETKEESDNAKG